MFIFRPTNTNVDFVSVKSLNLQMTDYQMIIEIINNNSNEGKVSRDWIGGQQFLIKSKDALFSPTNEYKVTIVAKDKGMFTIEPRTSKTLILLSENMIKFESLKEAQRNCYTYDISEQYKNDDLIVNMNLVKGSAALLLSPDNGSTFPIGLNIPVQSSHFDLQQSTRRKFNSESGTWLICVQSKSNSLYTLQVFLKQLADNKENYHNNLVSLLKGDDMEDHQLLKKRMLIQNSAENAIIRQAVTPQAPAPAPSPGISINGYGIAGIASMIIFMVAVLIALTCLDNIFVSTKFVEHPLLLGKVEF